MPEETTSTEQASAPSRSASAPAEAAPAPEATNVATCPQCLRPSRVVREGVVHCVRCGEQIIGSNPSEVTY